MSQEQASQLREPKRRKVRKGTQSCWECKRRKIRCIFTSALGDICDRCSRRGTSCVSQEFPDEPVPKKSVEERLTRLEMLIEGLTHKVGCDGISDNLVRRFQENAGLNSKFYAPTSSSGVRSTVTCEVSHSTQRGRDSDDALRYPESHVSSGPMLKQSYAAKITFPWQNSQGFQELSHTLMSAWPSKSDLDLILEVPVEQSRFLHGIACSLEDVPSAREMLQLPPQGSHPVFLAWKLLSLAKYLQAILPSSVHKLNGLVIDYHSVMVRAAETAHIIICNEEVIYSIEGIECIMLESLYHNDAGSLRLSLLAVRRGIALAELMGLYRKKPFALTFLKPETRLRVKPKHLWFRLVHLDRYLSLMLGLPQGSLDDSFASDEALKDCQPLERLQRIDCVAAGRILRRGEANMIDLNSAQDIDTLLQKAAASMPGQWWLVPKLTASGTDATQVLEETDRLMCQIAHFHILARLHLPYVLWADQNHYNCITAVNASREVLTRFVSFPVRTGRCYRSTLFLAFIASVTICLAHINSHVSSQKASMDINLLAHQRLGDRGMMERALELMEPISSDAATTRIVAILRHLLLIEDDATQGGSYDAHAFRVCSEEELECDGKMSENGNVLCIYIPHLGTIQVTRHASKKSTLPLQMRYTEAIVPVASVTGTIAPLNSAPPCDEPERHQDQSFKIPISAAAYTLGDELANNPEWHAQPSHFDSAELRHYSPSCPEASSVLSNINNGSSDTNLVPELDSFIDDWALQSVDMALFDDILHEASSSGYNGGASWGAVGRQ